MPCITYSDAQVLRETCATPILKQVTLYMFLPKWKASHYMLRIGFSYSSFLHCSCFPHKYWLHNNIDMLNLLIYWRMQILPVAKAY